MVEFDMPLEAASFLARPNRYRVDVRLARDGRIVAAHCPDPGRLHELLLPGVLVYVSPVEPRPAERRKTAFDLRLVAHPQDGTLISLDTRLPNRLVGEALAARQLPPLVDLMAVRREVSVPNAIAGEGVRSRIDFCAVDRSGRRTWIEVKSVTLVEAQVALFPDAVTARGRRHLLELADLARQGDRAVVIFVVQRPDAQLVRAHRLNDPALAEALDMAAGAGVEFYAWICTVTLQGAALLEPIAVETGHNFDDHETHSR